MSLLFRSVAGLKTERHFEAEEWLGVLREVRGSWLLALGESNWTCFVGHK